jgi:hypothetical protein
LEGTLDDNVIEIVGKQFSIEQDVKEFIKEIRGSEAFSGHKVHLQMLLAEVCASDKASVEVRKMAARALIETSDITAAIINVPDSDAIVTEFWDKINKDVSVRR